MPGKENEQDRSNRLRKISRECTPLGSLEATTSLNFVLSVSLEAHGARNRGGAVVQEQAVADAASRQVGPAPLGKASPRC